MAPHKYDTILIDPDINSRMRLKQATASVHNFGNVTQVGSLDEALSKLRGSDNCDIIFISYRFPQDAVLQFIKQGKEAPRGQDSAYVQVLRNNSGDSSTIAQSVIGGADGMLFEPYSVTSLVEIADLAARVKSERSSSREKAALQVLISEVREHINQLAFVKAGKMDIARPMKKLSEMTNILKTLSPESLTLYHELLVEAMEKAPLEANPSKYKQYAGVSARARKRLEQKVLAEMDAGAKKE